MKTSVIILSLLFPLACFAQNYQGMSETDMQKMMQQTQKMEACMQDVDQARLQELEQRAKQFEAEIKSLCASGKRDEAQAKTIAFGKEMENDTTLQKTKKCGELMQGMMPKMPYMDQDEDRSGHVCD